MSQISQKKCVTNWTITYLSIQTTRKLGYINSGRFIREMSWQRQYASRPHTQDPDGAGIQRAPTPHASGPWLCEYTSCRSVGPHFASLSNHLGGVPWFSPS